MKDNKNRYNRQKERQCFGEKARPTSAHHSAQTALNVDFQDPPDISAEPKI